MAECDSYQYAVSFLSCFIFVTVIVVFLLVLQRIQHKREICRLRVLSLSMVYLSRSGTTDINEALSLYRQIESIIPSAGGITLCGLLCRKRDSESTTVWHQDSGDLENGPTLNERAESKRCVAVDDSVSDVGNDSLPCGVRVESTRPATERDYVEVDFPAAPPFPKRSQTLPRKSVRVTSHPDKGYSMVRLSRLLNNKNPTPDSNRPVYSKVIISRKQNKRN